MRSVLSIAFALLIMFQSLSMVWVVVSFKINRDYIAKNLCVNRNKPQKKCNGRCRLTQKLAENREQKPDQSPVVPQPEEFKQILAILDACNLAIPVAKTTTHRGVFANNTFTAQSCVIDIFQPPKARIFQPLA